MVTSHDIQPGNGMDIALGQKRADTDKKFTIIKNIQTHSQKANQKIKQTGLS